MAKLTAVGVHIFAGGFTVGMSKRFKILAHNELGPFGVKTFKQNFPNVPVHYPLDAWTDYPGVDVIYSNPPCASFHAISGDKQKEKAGGVEKWRTDERLECWNQASRYALKHKPQMFIGESIPRFITVGRPFAFSLARDWINAGYEVTLLQHNVKFTGGAAQSRQRVFFIASRHELVIPKPNTMQVTVHDVLQGLENLGIEKPIPDRFLKALERMEKKGMRKLRDAWALSQKTEVLRHGPRFGDKRIRWDETCPTIWGPTLIHPEEPRYFSINELSRLMGFEDDWKWYGKSYLNVLVQMIRGVTPYAGEYAADIAAASIKKSKPAVKRVRIIDHGAKSLRTNDYNVADTIEDVTDEVMSQQ